MQSFLYLPLNFLFIPPRLQIPGAAPLDVVYSQKPRPARFEDDYEDVGPQTFPQQAPQQPRKDAFPSQLFTQAAPSPKSNVISYILNYIKGSP